MIRVEVFGLLGDDILVKVFWKIFWWLILGRRVDDLVCFFFFDCFEFMSYMSLFSWS